MNPDLFERIIMRLLEDKEWRRLIPRLIMGLVSFVLFMVLLSIILLLAVIEKGMA